MTLLRWIFAYLFDCVHSRTTWPHKSRLGHAYVCCLECGREMPYSLEHMRVAQQEAKANISSSRSPVTASLIMAGALLLLTPSYAIAETNLASTRIAKAGVHSSRVNIQKQTACESEMLDGIGAHEIFSGIAYEVLNVISQVYGHATPHIYLFPGSWNMSYIAASTATDGRGKIIVGQQAIKLFDTVELEGFLGHEMAHLVRDNGAQGCNDYILRDPKTEADADALAARTLGNRPVKAFLERVLVLTESQNWDAKRRLEILQ
jgi:hypothetical protein